MSNIQAIEPIMQEENELDLLPKHRATEVHLVETRHARGSYSYSLWDSQADAIKCKARWDAEYPDSIHTVVCFVRRECSEQLIADARQQTIQQVKRVIAARMEEL